MTVARLTAMRPSCYPAPHFMNEGRCVQPQQFTCGERGRAALPIDGSFPRLPLEGLKEPEKCVDSEGSA